MIPRPATTTSRLATSVTSSLLVDCLGLAVPISLLWLLYWRVTEAWWLSDDPGILKSLIEFGIARHFFNPVVWRQFSPSNFTPWVQLSLGLDYHLFGLNPRGFYFHHLISFSLVIALAYVMLRDFFGAFACSLALCVFVASAPSATAAQFLMVRHYVEGLGLCCAAVFCYVRAVRQRRLSWAWLSGVCYLLACTTKEIYLPLVLVLPALPVGVFKTRVRTALPAVFAAGVCVLWRAFMLRPENLLAGYGDVLGPPSAETSVSLPWRIAQTLGWTSAWPWLVLALTLMPGAWALIKTRRTEQRARPIILIIVLFLAGAAPILPVLRILSERYLFLPVFLIAVAIGAGLTGYSRSDGWGGLSPSAARAAGVVLGLCWLCVVLGVVERGSFRSAAQAFRATGQFVLSGGEQGEMLLNPPGALWFYAPLQWLRKRALNLPPGPLVCYDLCACRAERLNAAYRYQDGKLERSSVTEALEQPCDRSAPLTVELDYRPGAIHWRFGPHNNGRYFFVGAEGEADLSGYFLQLTPVGKFPLELREPLHFIVKHVSDAGRATYSPVLTLDPGRSTVGGAVEVRWARSSRDL